MFQVLLYAHVICIELWKGLRIIKILKIVTKVIFVFFNCVDAIECASLTTPFSYIQHIQLEIPYKYTKLEF